MDATRGISGDATKIHQGQPGVLWLRLDHLLYAMTLLFASLLVLGPLGCLLGIGVISFWRLIFTSGARPATFYRCAGVVLGGFLVLFLFWSTACSLGPPWSMHCQNNLMQISLALEQYHTIYGSYPPAFTADENGQPKHSWRVLLLPLLDEQPLYDAYNFDEPWNGPNNKKLIKHMPRVYACPYDAKDEHPCRWHTSYVAVVGSTTAWPPAMAATRSDIPDGASRTVLIVEDASVDIPWLEPRDLSFDAALEQFSSHDLQHAGGHRWTTFFFDYRAGSHVVLGGRSVMRVSPAVGPEVWSALLRKDDGEAWQRADLERGPNVLTRLRIGNCIRLAMLLVLAILPLPWVWWNPTSEF